MLANGTGNAIVKTGGDSWYFITADYAFGLALERDTEAVVLKHGGKVLGKVRHPLNAQDFSSFLLQAPASKAKVIGLADAGARRRPKAPPRLPRPGEEACGVHGSRRLLQVRRDHPRRSGFPAVERRRLPAGEIGPERTLKRRSWKYSESRLRRCSASC